MKKQAVLFCMVMLAYMVCNGQDKWTLKVNKEGIEIYTRHAAHSDVKAIKVNCVLPVTLSQLVAVIMDVNTGADWVYSTKSSVLLKKVSPAELYYYSEVQLPWPASNRDFVAHLIVHQDPQTKTVTVDGLMAADYIPVKKNIVRVTQSTGKWVISPAGNNTVRIEYTLEADPGGTIPAWLVNMFVTRGPLETFRKLKQQVQKPAYRNIHLPFIAD
jgi:hypothetical protein